MKRQYVRHSPIDRAYLEALISRGELKAETYRRALSLLELDRGQTYTAVSKTMEMDISTACSTPPEGHAEWSLRLLADKAVELDFCEHISHTEVRTILKKTESNRI